jgi:hypothetical protein
MNEPKKLSVPIDMPQRAHKKKIKPKRQSQRWASAGFKR